MGDAHPLSRASPSRPSSLHRSHEPACASRRPQGHPRPHHRVRSAFVPFLLSPSRTLTPPAHTQPFRNFNENPSWLAVRPLHNAVFWTQALPLMPDTEDEFAMHTDEPEYAQATPLPIHITVAQIPMTYAGVLATVPTLHARPPVLPPSPDPTLAMPPAPESGYDFILHVALAGRGPLRFEKLAHKHGFAMKDAAGQYAPALPKEHPTTATEASEIERMSMEMHLQGIIPSSAPVEGRGTHDGPEIPPNRGFGKGYENFPEEIHTDIDVAKLTHFLKEIELPDDEEEAMKVRVHSVCRLVLVCSRLTCRSDHTPPWMRATTSATLRTTARSQRQSGCRQSRRSRRTGGVLQGAHPSWRCTPHLQTSHSRQSRSQRRSESSSSGYAAS